MGAAAAVEATIEGLPGAVSLAPPSAMPVFGGELVLPDERATAPRDDVGTKAVRNGLLQAGPLAVAGLLSNGANVIVTVVLARLLTTRGYGVLNQLNGMFLIVSMPGSAVIVAVVRQLTAWREAGMPDLAQRWARRLHRQGLVAVVAVAAVGAVALAPFLTHLLRQRNPVGVEGVLGAGAVWVLLCLDRGLLQAHRGYRTLSANLVLEGGVRSVAMVAMVAAGTGAPGAAVGLFFAEVATAVHARWAADRVAGVAGSLGPRDGTAGLSWPNRLHRAASAQRERWWSAFTNGGGQGPPVDRRNGQEAGPRSVARRRGTGFAARHRIVTDLLVALVALALVAYLQNVDVIVMGREAPAVSGSYAAVSVASKALVFGAIVLGGYLLPEAAIRWHQGGHALRQLGVTMLLLAVPAVLLLVLALGAPHLLLSIVFSSRYLGAEQAFVPLVLAMVCLSTTVILTMYLLAVGRRWMAVVLVVGAAVTTVAVVGAHGNPRATAMADLMAQGAIAAVTAAGFVKVHHRRLIES